MFCREFCNVYLGLPLQMCDCLLSLSVLFFPLQFVLCTAVEGKCNFVLVGPITRPNMNYFTVDKKLFTDTEQYKWLWCLRNKWGVSQCRMIYFLYQVIMYIQYIHIYMCCLEWSSWPIFTIGYFVLTHLPVKWALLALNRALTFFLPEKVWSHPSAIFCCQKSQLQRAIIPCMCEYVSRMFINLVLNFEFQSILQRILLGSSLKVIFVIDCKNVWHYRNHLCVSVLREDRFPQHISLVKVTAWVQ